MDSLSDSLFGKTEGVRASRRAGTMSASFVEASVS